MIQSKFLILCEAFNQLFSRTFNFTTEMFRTRVLYSFTIVQLLEFISLSISVYFLAILLHYFFFIGFQIKYLLKFQRLDSGIGQLLNSHFSISHHIVFNLFYFTEESGTNVRKLKWKKIENEKQNIKLTIYASVIVLNMSLCIVCLFGYCCFLYFTLVFVSF